MIWRGALAPPICCGDGNVIHRLLKQELRAIQPHCLSGAYLRLPSAVQSVIDIDGPATFIDPGNIEKEKNGPYDTNTRLIGGFDEFLKKTMKSALHSHREGSLLPKGEGENETQGRR